MSSTTEAGSPSGVARLHGVVVRFAGDSGDGMQVTGDRFTTGSALFGNDLATFPSFPAEIRAPAGTLAGVSAFQVHIADHDILTPGDAPDVLVAMNPAALRANLGEVVAGGTVIVNSDAFDERSLEKAGYSSDPRGDGTLAGYQCLEVPMTSLTLEAVKPTGAKPRDAERSKNFFALGLASWLYHRPLEPTLAFIAERFAAKPLVVEANRLAFLAGYHFGETAELFRSSYEVPPSELPPGRYTNITGNTALAYGLIAAARVAGLPLFLGSYPITPASDLLHELAKQKHFEVTTFQAEDEIAGVAAALGASYGGALGVTTTSGPGLDLKAETIGLAVSLELPLLVVDVQRAGPSTGMPTKPEQSDLLHALFGRHGEAPVPVIAPASPGRCFDAALEAARIAITYRTPVYLLSDAYLANGSEPWRIPEAASLAPIDPGFAEPGGERFAPYARDARGARPWAPPGVAGLEHRVGGLEKADGAGSVSYDGENHERMVRLRAQKIANVATEIPPVDCDADDGARLLVLGWGSTYGAIKAAVDSLRAAGHPLARAHLEWVHPFPENLGALLGRFAGVLVCENNLGQLTMLLRARYLVDATVLASVKGRPFHIQEIEEAILTRLAELPLEKEQR